jgi:hypothetical protein
VRKSWLGVTLLAVAGCICSGCGSSRQALVSVSVSPTAATATPGSANDTVRFVATGNYATYDRGYYGPNATAVCLIHTSDSSRPLTQVTWSTSDSANTSIDSTGSATCLQITAEPATITAFASGVCGGEKATAKLICN